MEYSVLGTENELSINTMLSICECKVSFHPNLVHISRHKRNKSIRLKIILQRGVVSNVTLYSDRQCSRVSLTVVWPGRRSSRAPGYRSLPQFQSMYKETL